VLGVGVSCSISLPVVLLGLTSWILQVHSFATRASRVTAAEITVTEMWTECVSCIEKPGAYMRNA
jgi:hypothetical protein